MKSKKDIIKSVSVHNKDVGSASVQIALLSEKINKLSEHFKKFSKDKHSSRGLAQSVNKRKRLLSYLSKNNPEVYKDLIKKLNLRK
jgi:small subunit ribosomal protein S15|tara:strand:+ start:486 stop:743 length:258 start_codon:yes stop_codon:yes gene_type:complete